MDVDGAIADAFIVLATIGAGVFYHQIVKALVVAGLMTGERTIWIASKVILLASVAILLAAAITAPKQTDPRDLDRAISYIIDRDRATALALLRGRNDELILDTYQSLLFDRTLLSWAIVVTILTVAAAGSRTMAEEMDIILARHKRRMKKEAPRAPER